MRLHRHRYVYTDIDTCTQTHVTSKHLHLDAGQIPVHSNLKVCRYFVSHFVDLPQSVCCVCLSPLQGPYSPLCVYVCVCVCVCVRAWLSVCLSVCVCVCTERSCEPTVNRCGLCAWLGAFRLPAYGQAQSNVRVYMEREVIRGEEEEEEEEEDKCI